MYVCACVCFCVYYRKIRCNEETRTRQVSNLVKINSPCAF